MALEDKIDQHPNPELAPEVDQRQPLVDELSRKWFGITSEDTRFEDNDDLEERVWQTAYYDWEANFTFTLFDGREEEELAVWDALGWDCRDSDGALFWIIGHFERQMICAAKGLKGRLPDAELSDDEVRDAAEAWAARLTYRR